MKNKLHCVYAFHNISVNSTGTIKHCCVINGSTTDTVLNKSIEELSTDPWMEEVRNYFREEKRHPSCYKCWEEEDAGVYSKRIFANQKFNFKENDGIKIIELNMGNTCNIKCRTCSPYSSSQWVKESYETTDPQLKSDYKTFLIDSKKYNNSWDVDSPIWKDLETLGDNLVVIDFYGGEPWLIKQQWEFIRTCVKNDWAKNIKLHYNTNGTQWPEDLIPLLENFKFVGIGFSIDGIGTQFEFMRHPANWNEVYANMLKARAWSKNKSNIYFDVCLTISALNVYNVPETVEFLQKDWSIYLNLVHQPNYYSIQVFPDAIKDIICKKLETVNRLNEQVWHQLSGIIQFIKNGKFDKTLWQEFKEKISIHDTYRKENFYETFDEFGKIISNY